MILTGAEIKKRIESGSIVINGYKEDNVNPNSYDLTLSPDLKIYIDPILDPRKQNATQIMVIPEEGLVLKPGQLYLASTNEYTESLGLVPKLYGKSSLGRLGLETCVGSGYGDVGFRGQWTLALRSTNFMKIYPGMKICQLEFSTTVGEGTIQYNGKYQDSSGAIASKSFIKE
jgi:deoxycytidine triphosphate deaminase